jgi:hypothetical protein
MRHAGTVIENTSIYARILFIAPHTSIKLATIDDTRAYLRR